jgi:2-dehydro-3-deoxyphosphogluconate aldolase / (4S)-4-hydroxy-2-oxoglutarate aldolase
MTGEPHPLESVGPVVPVVVLDDAAQAVPLARALAAGGVRVMEVTLRTAAGVAAIERVAAEVPEVLVGAGSVRTPQELDAVCRVGASFVVLPGAPARLLDAALDSGVPVVPGASTVTEMMTLAERGIELMKFFPAEACGGVRFLSSVTAPLPNLRFCPTGGVTAASASSYLSLRSVVCVGGSWLTPPQLLATADWGKVTDLAAAAAGFRRQPTG